MLVPQEGNATFWFILPFKWFYVIFSWAKIFSKLVLSVQNFTLSHSKIKTLWSHWHAPSYCFHPREMSSSDDVSLFTDVPVAACLQQGQCRGRTHPGCYCTFAGQAMGGDSRKTLSADVTESGSGMGAGVPVMHPWEMFHIKLGHLEMRR